MTMHLDMPPNKCSESLSHHPKEFGFNVKDSSLCHSLSTFGCFFLTFSFLISVSQMRVCSGKRLLPSGMRQIWTCPTRGSLTTLMTVSSFLFSLFFVNFLIRRISPGQIIFRPKRMEHWLSACTVCGLCFLNQHFPVPETEWLRPSVPNSSWRESNLDGPPPAPSPKKVGG